MYDELIKRLRNRRICIQQSGSLDDFPLLAEAADAIEELSAIREEQKAEIILMAAEDKPRWIPVTERLPETHGEYMVAYHPCYWDRVHDEIKVGLDSFRGKTSWAKKKYQRVTHWMPLPPAPKEET